MRALASDLAALAVGPVCGGEGFAHDFGGIVRRVPAAVVRPEDARGVAAVLRFASAHGVPVTSRGAAHSQSGQSLCDDGIVLDLAGLDRIDPIDRSAGAIGLGAGVRWGDVVERTLAEGLLPPVLTSVSDLTVGGTHAVGGWGRGTFHHGILADQCIAVEWVTGSGEILRCGPEDPAFRHALCTLGQFGVLTHVSHRLVAASGAARTHLVLYVGVDAMLEDARRLFDRPEVAFVASAGISPLARRGVVCPTVVLETGASQEEIDRRRTLSGLRFARHVSSSALSPAEAARLAPGADPRPNVHPWLDVILPFSRVAAYLDALLSRIDPALLARSQIYAWPARLAAVTSPFFMVPDERPLVLFGVHPTIPPEDAEAGISFVEAASDLAMESGGRRYPSGWLRFDRARWRAHYGARWDELMALKAEYDPSHILQRNLVEHDH